jgi:hypothetical protein
LAHLIQIDTLSAYNYDRAISSINIVKHLVVLYNILIKFLNGNSGFVVSKTKKFQRLSKIFSAYCKRLFKDLWEQSAVEKLRGISTIFTR